MAPFRSLRSAAAAIVCIVAASPPAVEAARTGILDHAVGRIEAGQTLRMRLKLTPGPAEIALRIERGAGVLFSVADLAGGALCGERSDHCAFVALGDVEVRLVNRSGAQAAYRLQWTTAGR